jgi:hypothetical protein
VMNICGKQEILLNTSNRKMLTGEMILPQDSQVWLI